MSLITPRETPQTGSRILVCRLSHIGDCILTLPMLARLREAMPDSWIAWATENPSPQLLEGHRDLDHVITVPKGWMKSLSSIWSVRKELRKYRFNITIDPQSICKSAMLARISGAKTRAGFSGSHGRELSTWFNNRKIEPQSTHLVDRSMELLQALGIESRPEGTKACFQIPLRETAACYIDQFLQEKQLYDHRFIVINPGGSWPSKRWENDRFGQLAKRLHSLTGIPSLVTWSGNEEYEMARSICETAGGDSAWMAPETDLQQLAALLQSADLFVGCDTGPLHLAAAMNTICIGLYGPTRPQDSGAYGQEHYAIQNRYHAGSCRERRNATNEAMRTIDVQHVLDACCRGLAALRNSDSSHDGSRRVA